MADVYLVATFVNELDDMEAILRLHNLGHFPRVCQVKCHSSKGRVKMDIAFIRNIERDEKDFRLVELIIDIARYLKVPVVAEGVETENQLKLLREAGCDIVQGYYFSRALPAEEFEQKILSSLTNTR